MVRFVARGVLFLAILLVLAGALSRFSKMYPHGDAVKRHLDRIHTAYRQADSTEILLLGNSHITYGVDAGMLPGRAQVLGLHWNDVFEVQHQVRVLLPRMPRLHTVIISLSYFSFQWDNAVGDDEYYLSSRHLFYAEQGLGPWIPGDFGNYVVGKTFWLSRPDHWYNVVAGLRRRIEWEPVDPPLQSWEDLEEDAEMRTGRFMRSTAVMREARNDLSQATYDATIATILKLQSRGVAVILVTPPLHQTYAARVEATAIPAEMRRIAQRIADEYNVVWIDGRESGLSGSAELFMDSDHLNPAGRARFTSWMLEKLERHRMAAAGPGAIPCVSR
jgi:hypothetical protein